MATGFENWINDNAQMTLGIYQVVDRYSMLTDMQILLKHFWKTKIDLELQEKQLNLFTYRSHLIMTKYLNHNAEGKFPKKLLRKSKHSGIASGFGPHTKYFASSAHITCQQKLYWNQQDDSWIKDFLSMSKSSSWSLLQLFLWIPRWTIISLVFS